MRTRALQRWLLRLARFVTPADMCEWSAAMIREIEEIDDDRVALGWAAACLMSCLARRLRTVLRVVAIAARYVVGGYCLVSCGQIVLKSARLIGEGQTTLGLTAFWLFIALLFGATAPLVALRQPAAAWTLSAVTAAMTVNFFVNVNVSVGSAAKVSQELTMAGSMFAALLGLTGAAFLLTRRPDADLTN